MAGKGFEYWEKRWDENLVFGDDAEVEAKKIIKLFREYTCYQGQLLSPLSRFFVGRWNTHHAHEVINAIGKQLESMSDLGNSPYQLLSAIKREMKDKKISPHGDFFQIMQVITRKTNQKLNYFILEISLFDKMQMALKIAEKFHLNNSGNYLWLKDYVFLDAGSEMGEKEYLNEVSKTHHQIPALEYYEALLLELVTSLGLDKIISALRHDIPYETSQYSREERLARN